MKSTDIEFRKLSDCTYDQSLELWNVGFQHYFTDMTRSLDQYVFRMKNNLIYPQHSVAAFIDNKPAGFVLHGLKTVNGVKMGWNGGTGVSPEFRGRGLGKDLMAESARVLRELDVDYASLEVVTENYGAIKIYQSVGYEIEYEISSFNQKGSFSALPFQFNGSMNYRLNKVSVQEACQLPFFKHDTSWNSRWFIVVEKGAQAAIIYDSIGDAIGYIVYIEQLNDKGILQSISINHCEAKPDRDDQEQILRFGLYQAFSPIDFTCKRTLGNVSNKMLIEIVKQEGFQETSKQYEMKLQLK